MVFARHQKYGEISPVNKMHVSLSTDAPFASIWTSKLNLLLKWEVRHTSWVFGFISVLFGLCLSAFHISYGQTHVSLLLLAVVCMSLPTIVLIFTANLDNQNQEYALLALLLVSSLFVRYVFAFTNPFIAGTDAPFHLFHTQQVANGFWPSDSRISEAWPLLYLIYGGLSRLTTIPVPFLATWFHPMLNVVTIYCFYVYLRGVVSVRTAMIAIYIYIWEYTSFFFGFEFRTQSLAIAFFATFLALRRFAILTTNRRNRIVLHVISTIMLIAIALSAFVSSILVAILFGAMAVGRWLEHRHLGTRDEMMTENAGVVVLVAMISYLIYNISGVNQIVPYLWNILKSTLAFERINDANLKGVIVLGYGSFVTIVQWLLRLVFLGGLGIESFHFLRASKRVRGAPMVATIVLLGLVTVATPLGSALSPGRYFQYLSPFFGLYSAIFITAFFERISPTIWRRLTWISIAILLSLWSISGVLKLPPALIDPLRVQEPIPARIGWETVTLVHQLSEQISTPNTFICADKDLTNALYATNGLEADQVLIDDSDIAKCVSKSAQSRQTKKIFILVGGLFPKDNDMLFSTYNFKLVRRTDLIRVFVQGDGL